MNSKIKSKTANGAGGGQWPVGCVLFFLTLCLCVSVSHLQAQTPEFTYQGSLKAGGIPANGSFDLEFRIFDALSGGSQAGSTITRAGTTVTDGIFSVNLNFGQVFSGNARYLEIAVKPAANPPPFTTLLPRSQLTSVPYSVKSLNADSATNANNALALGGVAANQFVVTTDPRMTDARPPTAGSGGYVQNTTSPQATSNFNVSGTGKADIINAVSAYQYNGSRILWHFNSSLFLGPAAGASTDPAILSPYNTFIGTLSGSNTVSGRANTFLGSDSGYKNVSGNTNSFIGFHAGYANIAGDDNVFVGASAGDANVAGSGNTMIGSAANVGTGGLSFATAIGAESIASQSNSVYLGRPGGEDTVRIPGAVIINGSLVVDSLGGTTGNVHLCRNTANRISLCTSNLAGPDENKALTDHVNDQQKQIEAQRAEIEVLKVIVCELKPSAAICKKKAN